MSSRSIEFFLVRLTLLASSNGLFQITVRLEILRH